MKAGNLVKRIDNWVKHNPWMEDNIEYGIIIAMPEKNTFKCSIKVLWATLGIMMEHPDDIEVLGR